MNTEIINFFESIKLGKFDVSAAESKLGNECKELILKWYKKYAEINDNNVSLVDIIGLAYFLYIRENIDLYSIDDYHRTVETIAIEYNIRENCFLQMLTDYRRMLFSSTLNEG